MAKVVEFEQLSLFTMPEIRGVVAVSCMDGEKMQAEKPEPWMTRLVAGGKYVVDIGGHPLVLRPASVSVDSIPEGHQFYHFLICGEVYAGVFVGSESA